MSGGWWVVWEVEMCWSVIVGSKMETNRSRGLMDKALPSYDCLQVLGSNLSARLSLPFLASVLPTPAGTGTATARRKKAI